MKESNVLLSIVALMSLVGICNAVDEQSRIGGHSTHIWERETLTNGFCGLNDELTDKGIEVDLGVTGIYQQNVRGGISKHRRAGRFSGSYDLELSADLQKLLGFESGSLFVRIEGGWPNTEGIDGVSVGSVFGVNADAIGNRTMDVVELFYEGSIFDDGLTLMVGKIDFTCIFDASAYADDETSQFLSVAFVDDPTIPFPDYSLGAVLTWNVTDSWYVMGGVADAQADGRETVFNTTFHKEDYFFYALESGIIPQFHSTNGPLQGTHRAGLWYDPQPKAHSDSARNYRDDVGFYLSCDQMLVKENADPEDNQGLGGFFRYGYANSKRNDIANFWSVGFQYQGLIEGRDNDVLGVGFAHGVFSNMASSTYPEDYENVLELYYNTQICPWLNVSPSIQYIANPGGTKGASDAVVLGLRVQMRF